MWRWRSATPALARSQPCSNASSASRPARTSAELRRGSMDDPRLRCRRVSRRECFHFDAGHQLAGNRRDVLHPALIRHHRFALEAVPATQRKLQILEKRFSGDAGVIRNFDVDPQFLMACEFGINDIANPVVGFGSQSSVNAKAGDVVVVEWNVFDHGELQHSKYGHVSSVKGRKTMPDVSGVSG